jgi:hypothetical protein
MTGAGRDRWRTSSDKSRRADGAVRAARAGRRACGRRRVLAGTAAAGPRGQPAGRHLGAAGTITARHLACGAITRDRPAAAGAVASWQPASTRRACSGPPSWRRPSYSGRIRRSSPRSDLACSTSKSTWRRRPRRGVGLVHRRRHPHGGGHDRESVRRGPGRLRARAGEPHHGGRRGPQGRPRVGPGVGPRDGNALHLASPTGTSSSPILTLVTGPRSCAQDYAWDRRQSTQSHPTPARRPRKTRFARLLDRSAPIPSPLRRGAPLPARDPAPRQDPGRRVCDQRRVRELPAGQEVRLHAGLQLHASAE